MMRLIGLYIVLGTAIFMPSAHAQAPTSQQIRQAQVETLRKQMTNQIQLQANELLDQLVYDWKKTPAFPAATAVVLADVTAPTGFGSGFEALLENHIAQLLIQNPDTNITLAHCPSCRALTVHSEKSGTIISRGIDDPASLLKISASFKSKYALFLDFEAEGTALVLRARMTQLSDELPIVFARTLSTKTSSAPLLREPDALLDAKTVREDYVNTLKERGRLAFPIRLAVSSFAPPDGGVVSVPPFYWISAGVEMALTNARAWKGSLSVGGNYIPVTYSGFLIQARASRLLSGRATSITRPNVYGFIGVSLGTIFGPTALAMGDEVPSVTQVLAIANGLNSSFINYPTFQSGLEVKVGNRLGIALTAENAITLDSSPQIGRFVNFGIFRVNAIGGEVSFTF